MFLKKVLLCALTPGSELPNSRLTSVSAKSPSSPSSRRGRRALDRGGGQPLLRGPPQRGGQDDDGV